MPYPCELPSHSRLVSSLTLYGDVSFRTSRSPVVQEPLQSEPLQSEPSRSEPLQPEQPVALTFPSEDLTRYLLSNLPPRMESMGLWSSKSKDELENIIWNLLTEFCRTTLASSITSAHTDPGIGQANLADSYELALLEGSTLISHNPDIATAGDITAMPETMQGLLDFSSHQLWSDLPENLGTYVFAEENSPSGSSSGK